MSLVTKRKRKSSADNDHHVGGNDDDGTNDSIKIKIQVAEENTAPQGHPIVVSFPGGVPESASLSSLRFMWQKLSMNHKSKSGRRVVGFDKICMYTASSKGVGLEHRPTKLVVGVYHKKRNKLILYEVATEGTVYALQQSVPSYLQQNNGVETGKGSIDKPNVYEDFGSAKKRKVLKSQAAGRVDLQNVVGAGSGSAIVHQVVKGQGMSESNRKAIEEDRRADSTQQSAAEMALQAGRIQILPAFDEYAVKPDKAYDAKEIAGIKAWKNVHDKVYACLHMANPTDAIIESIFEKDWQEFVLKLVRDVDPDSDNAPFRLTCAILVNWMVKFYNANNKRRSFDGYDEANATHFGVPTAVAARCFQLFTTSISVPGHQTSSKGKFLMTNVNKEKMIVHILLLFMMANGPGMRISSVNAIAESLKVPKGQCVNLLKYAGCRVAKNGSDYSASLKTPLEFPKMGRRALPQR